MNVSPFRLKSFYLAFRLLESQSPYQTCYAEVLREASASHHLQACLNASPAVSEGLHFNKGEVTRSRLVPSRVIARTGERRVFAMSTSVLITGGLGFVGSAVVAALQESHPEWILSVLDLTEPVDLQASVTHCKCDITDSARVEEVVSCIRPTAIIHTAGIVPELADRYGRKARERVFKVNLDGTRNILVAAKRSDVKAVVWTGSCTAVTDDFSKQYPNIDESWPVSSHSLVYGESKASLSLLLSRNIR